MFCRVLGITTPVSVTSLGGVQTLGVVLVGGGVEMGVLRGVRRGSDVRLFVVSVITDIIVCFLFKIFFVYVVEIYP